jgi:hypothetical protein
VSRRRAGFKPRVLRSSIGVVAAFEDPSGHSLFLYEPSEESLGTRSGQKIQDILTARF